MSENDSGGIAAKKGFLYQDYVAAYYALKMLSDKTIVEIRCEVSDDIDIVYESYIEYVQVKTTSSEKNWQLGELTDCSYKKSVTSTGKERKTKKDDSILHKSMDCDFGALSARFRIVTPRDVYARLAYLKIPVGARDNDDQRAKLLKSLQGKIKGYTTPNGKDVEYWLDNATWEVIPTKEQIILDAFKLIITFAYECYGVHLNPTRHPNSILNDLLVNIIDKSATSVVLNSKEDKIYTRKDFINWFRGEVLHYSGEALDNVKVYTINRAKLTAILSVFLELDGYDNHSGEKICRGLKGQYHRRKYEYNKISRGLLHWLPEVLLRPAELADQAPERLIEKLKEYTHRKKLNASNIKDFVANILLHSVVRTSFESQPIPAKLYVDDGKGTTFDNIHILLNEQEPDALLLGFSYLIDDNLVDSISEMVTDFNNLLESEAFTEKKEKILEEKQDGYLLKHDINDVLGSDTSLDENVSRFVFAFFIGYETSVLTCELAGAEKDLHEELEKEVQSHFGNLIDSLVQKDDYFKDLRVLVYLCPIPSMDSLIESVETEFSSS